MVGAALPADVEGGGQEERVGLEAKGGTNFFLLLAEMAEGAWERFMALNTQLSLRTIQPGHTSVSMSGKKNKLFIMCKH